MTEQTTERRNAALRQRAADSLTEVTSKFPFPDEADALRFAVGYALQAMLPTVAPNDLGPVTNKNWNVASLDPTGDIAALLRILHPEATDAYALLETLMNVGLVDLAARLTDDPTLRMRDLLSETADE